MSFLPLCVLVTADPSFTDLSETPHNVLLYEHMKISHPAAHQVDPWMNTLHYS